MTEYDCRACGACCVAPFDEPSYVSLDPVDERRLGRPFVRLHVIRHAIATKHVEVKRGPAAGSDACVCHALRGTPGVRVSCSVYERRPGICRTFQPGGSSCLGSRRELGMD